VTARIAVLASGSGSNLQAILDACDQKIINAEVVAVISDRSDAYALARAEAAVVPLVQTHERTSSDADRRSWDTALADLVESARPDWVVLAGFMRILSSSFLDRFPQHVINLHPALPGELPGIKAIERAFAEYTRGSRTHTGVMIHLVPDEGVDDGPVLGSTVVPILATDSVETLAARMHEAEHRLLTETLARLVQEVPA
jgi:phosphoribosylglycinamide formyltransferase 1